MKSRTFSIGHRIEYFIIFSKTIFRHSIFFKIIIIDEHSSQRYYWMKSKSKLFFSYNRLYRCPYPICRIYMYIYTNYLSLWKLHSDNFQMYISHKVRKHIKHTHVLYIHALYIICIYL